jgi:hypothetical protein
MTALVLPGDAPARLHRRVPWSPRAWSQALYLTGGIPALLAVPLIVALTVYAGRPHQAALVLPGMVLALLAVPLLSRLHRHRLRVTAGAEVPPQPFLPNGLTFTGLLTAARTGTTRRQLGYHVLAAPALAVGAIAAFGTWLAGVLYTLVYAYAWTLPAQSLLARGQSAGPGGGGGGGGPE